MGTRKGFKDYLFASPLTENSWLSKGFTVGQGNRHEGFRRQLDLLASQIKAGCEQGKRESELDKKIDVLFEINSRIAEGLKISGALSKSVINVGIASNLLEDDLNKVIAKHLQKTK